MKLQAQCSMLSIKLSPRFSITLISFLLSVIILATCFLIKSFLFQHFGHQYHPLTQTNNLLVTINSSVNFIIYCIFGHKFKRIFISLLCNLARGTPRQGNRVGKGIFQAFLSDLSVNYFHQH